MRHLSPGIFVGQTILVRWRDEAKEVGIPLPSLHRPKLKCSGRLSKNRLSRITRFLVLQLRFSGMTFPVAEFGEGLVSASPERPGEDHGEIGWAKGLADVSKKAAQLRHAERHQLGKSVT